MKKIIAIFVMACSVGGIIGCGGSKPTTGSDTDSTRKENTSFIMDSAAQSTPPTKVDSTKL